MSLPIYEMSIVTFVALNIIVGFVFIRSVNNKLSAFADIIYDGFSKPLTTTTSDCNESQNYTTIPLIEPTEETVWSGKTTGQLKEIIQSLSAQRLHRISGNQNSIPFSHNN